MSIINFDISFIPAAGELSAVKYPDFVYVKYNFWTIIQEIDWHSNWSKPEHVVSIIKKRCESDNDHSFTLDFIRKSEFLQRKVKQSGIPNVSPDVISHIVASGIAAYQMVEAQPNEYIEYTKKYHSFQPIDNELVKHQL